MHFTEKTFGLRYTLSEVSKEISLTILVANKTEVSCLKTNHFTENTVWHNNPHICQV